MATTSQQRRKTNGAFRSVLRNTGLAITIATSSLMLNVGLLRAQEPTAQPTQQQSQNTGTPNLSLNVLDTNATLNGTDTNQLGVKAQETFSNGQSLSIIGGRQDKVVNSDGDHTSGYDFGLKYAKGDDNGDNTWVRATYLDNFGRVSYGTEGKVYLFSLDDLKLSFLGDVSSQYLSSDAARHTNFGSGMNLNLMGNQNLFATYYSGGLVFKTKVGKKSVNSEMNEGGVRSGWVYTNNRDRLLSFVVDSQDTQKARFSAFGALPHARVLASYDPNSRIGYTQAYLTFGMSPLPNRTLTSQVLDQFVYKETSSLTKTGLTDSDNTGYFSTPPIYFVTKPKGEVGEFVKFTWRENPSDKGHKDFDLYGVTAIKRANMFVTQNVTEDALGNVHYGGGAGVKLWKHERVPAFVFVCQTSQSKLDVQGSMVFGIK
jgi:hypothetical protein